MRLLPVVGILVLSVILGIASGGIRGIIGWLLILYVVYRAAPGIWSDLRGLPKPGRVRLGKRSLSDSSL